VSAAATLSDRYISDRSLPDKAIDLIDEAASRIKMEIETKPADIDRLERKIAQIEVELASISAPTKRKPRSSGPGWRPRSRPPAPSWTS
jgi:ATP-dependent Clp protease ATP-binding subunit ClpB